MNIAFLYHESPFMSAMLAGLTARLERYGLHSWKAGDPAPANDLEIVLLSGHMGRDAMANQPKLALIQTTTAGYEGVDLEAATELGIWVGYAPASDTGNAVSVAEHAVLLLLGASRQLNEAVASVEDRSIRLTAPYRALSGKAVCIVGFGGIGRELAARLRPFGVRLLATDEHPDRAPADVTAYPPERLHDAIADADYVVLCVPASKDNENLIDARALAAMKDGAILVNVARGTLVDEDALAAAVQSGHIAAAGLDVLKTEPADPKNPLLSLPAVLITPHIAGSTDVMLHGTIDYIGRLVDDFSAGRKPKAILNDPPNPRHAFEDRNGAVTTAAR